MRYFTYELWSKLNSLSPIEREEAHSEWVENNEAYSTTFEKTKDRLSKSFLKTYWRKHGFHDFKIQDIKLSHNDYGTKNPISIEIVITDGLQTFRIAYKCVKRFNLNYEDVDLESSKGFDDWGYDEFLPVDEQFLSHEILFASGATIQIQFKNKNIFVTKVKQG